jgi:hypothetical protein
MTDKNYDVLVVDGVAHLQHARSGLVAACLSREDAREVGRALLRFACGGDEPPLLRVDLEESRRAARVYRERAHNVAAGVVLVVDALVDEIDRLTLAQRHHVVDANKLISGVVARRAARRRASQPEPEPEEQEQTFADFAESMRRAMTGQTNPGRENRPGCVFPHCGCGEPWEKCVAPWNG